MSVQTVPNNASKLDATLWSECGVAVIIVALRFWSRLKTKQTGADDWCMLLSLAILVALCAICSWYAALGGTEHVADLALLDDDRLAAVKHSNYVIQGLATASYAPAKTAVALLVLRMFGNLPRARFRWQRSLIISSLALVWASGTVCVVMIFVQCRPTRSLWLSDTKQQHVCWDPMIQVNFAVFTSAINIYCDVVLAIIPANLIMRLNRDLKRRVSLSILMGLGVIAAVLGIVKTAYLSELALRQDITWDTYKLIVCAVSELFVLIVCGSMPPLGYLVQHGWRRDGAGAGAEVVVEVEEDRRGDNEVEMGPVATSAIDDDVTRLVERERKNYLERESAGV